MEERGIQSTRLGGFIYTSCCAVIAKDTVPLIVWSGLSLKCQLVWHKGDHMFGVALPFINSDVQGLVKDIGKDELDDIRAPLPTHRCAYTCPLPCFHLG